MPKVGEPANDQSKGNLKKCQYGSSKTKGKIYKSVSLKNKNDTMTWQRHIKTLESNSRQKEEENTKINALARRKDYGTKRNLKKMLAFSNANRQVDGIKKKSKKIKPNDTKFQRELLLSTKKRMLSVKNPNKLAIELDKDISTTMVISIQQTRTKLHSKNQAGMVYRISWT